MKFYHFSPSTVVFSCRFQEDADQVTLYSYKVQSTITSRVANTVIQTKVVNHSPQPQNVVFDVQIPKGAFISNFSMWVTPTQNQKLDMLCSQNQTPPKVDLQCLNASWLHTQHLCCCLIAKFYLTLCYSIDCSPPGSFVHGSSQARILEQVAISSSRGSFWTKDWTRVSCIGKRILYHINHQGSPEWTLVVSNPRGSRFQSCGPTGHWVILGGTQ